MKKQYNLFIIASGLIAFHSIHTMNTNQDDLCIYDASLQTNNNIPSLQNSGSSTPFIGLNASVEDQFINGFESENGIDLKDINHSYNSTNDNSEAATPCKGSNSFTKFWFGIHKTLGLTTTEVFFQLKDNGTLEADLIQNSAEAIRRFEEATEERFKHRDLMSAQNQTKISRIFDIVQSLEHKTNKNFELHQTLAKEYYPLQEKALIAIIHKHATQDQLRLQIERDARIATAHNIYNQEMDTLRIFEAQTAANTRYVQKCAKATSPIDLQNEHHYHDLNSQEALLKSIRELKENIQ